MHCLAVLTWSPRGAAAWQGSVLCRAGQHVAVWLWSRTRTRRVIETGISCHRNSLTYLCHLNALHSEVGRFKKTQGALPLPAFQT